MSCFFRNPQKCSTKRRGAGKILPFFSCFMPLDNMTLPSRCVSEESLQWPGGDGASLQHGSGVAAAAANGLDTLAFSWELIVIMALGIMVIIFWGPETAFFGCG